MPESGERPLILPGGKVDEQAVRLAASVCDDGELPRVTFTMQRDLGARLDKYLTSRIPFMSRTQLQNLIGAGGVTINAAPAKASTKLRRGDVVEVSIAPPPGSEIQPEQGDLDVMYEDAHLIVLNKSPDVIVHPARSVLTGTLINYLAWHFEHESAGALSQVGEEYARPGVVHRLDRNTTGCIVFAKSDEAHWKLARQFELRRVEKRYLAIAHGAIEPAADTIDVPIGPHPSREKGYREKCVVRHDDAGKRAITRYVVREQYLLNGRPAGDQAFSLVELDLQTGRTHQIRVHLSWLGFPIMADTMYGGRPFEHDGRTVMDRQALHAALLAFTHPISGERLRFTAPLRADMRECITTLRGGSSGAQRAPAHGGMIDLEKLVA